MAGRHRAGHRDGRRVPVDRAVGRLPVVRAGAGPRPGVPAVRHHADAGLDNQLAFLDAALDYVAGHTPRDAETRYLEAVVTTWHNTDAPRGRRAAQRRPDDAMTAATADPPGARLAVAASTSCSAGRVSMRAMALLRVLVGPIVLLHLRPILDDAWHGRIYRDRFHEPYASWYPELPARRCTSPCCGSARVAAVAMTIGFLHAGRRRSSCSASSRTTCSCRRRTSTTTAPTS